MTPLTVGVPAVVGATLAPGDAPDDEQAAAITMATTKVTGTLMRRSGGPPGSFPINLIY